MCHNTAMNLRLGNALVTFFSRNTDNSERKFSCPVFVPDRILGIMVNVNIIYCGSS